MSLSGLKLIYLPGPDGVSAFILRKCVVVLSGPLTFILFNGLLRADYFPPICKSSFIIPLHKTGNRYNTSNIPLYCQTQCYSLVDEETGDGLSLF